LKNASAFVAGRMLAAERWHTICTQEIAIGLTGRL
jgi:hypothetical protein